MDGAFSSFFERSNLDQLDYDMALIAIEMLTTYANAENEVYYGFFWRGRQSYSKERFSFHGYDDLLLEEADRLLRFIARGESRWGRNPHGASLDKIEAYWRGRTHATDFEIAEHIAQLVVPFEENYHCTDIARAMTRAALTFAPESFIRINARTQRADLEGRAERERAFLDECLGEDRYPRKESEGDHDRFSSERDPEPD